MQLLKYFGLVADLFQSVEESAEFHAKAYRKFIHLRGVFDPGPIEIVNPSAFALKRPRKSFLEDQHAFTAELFVQQLANRVNELARILMSLRAWEIILREYNDEEQYYLRVEFVSPLLHLGIAEVSGIKNQLVFSAAKTAIQLESFNLKRDIPDDGKIDSSTWQSWCQGWPGFEALKKRVDALNSRDFLAGTRSFRNRRAHAIAPSFFGIVPAHRVSRDREWWKMEIRYEEPLDTGKATELLAQQHVIAVSAVEGLQHFFRARFDP